MKQQTAVEWLVEQLPMRIKNSMMDEIEQAKVMEKEQIENAYWEGGHDVPTHGRQCEQYYNETYKLE